MRELFRSSPSPAASRATSRPRRPAPSTRAASSATRWSTPTAPPSTTPTCSSAASSATARPRPGRWRRAGTPTSSSTRRATARCCRSCTSTATRSPTRRSSPASRATSCERCCEGYGYAPYFVEGDDPAAMHQRWPRRSTRSCDEIAAIQARRARGGRVERPALADDRAAHAQGLDRSRTRSTAIPVEGTWRSHQVPLTASRDPDHLALLEEWLRSYRPEELFDDDGRLRPGHGRLAPRRRPRMSANPHANGGAAARPAPARLPRLRRRRSRAGDDLARRHASSGSFLRDVIRATRELPLFGPDETASNRLGAVFEVTDASWRRDRPDGDDHLAPTGA